MCRIEPACRQGDVVVEVVARVELQHLPDLLLERHPAEEVGDALGIESAGSWYGSCVVRV